jgi:hypothetical protein
MGYVLAEFGLRGMMNEVLSGRLGCRWRKTYSRAWCYTLI